MHITRSFFNGAALISAAFLVTAALGAFTDFNSYAEGHYGSVEVFDGITFFDAEINHGPIESFAIDDVTDHWLEFPNSLPYVDGCVLNINGFGFGPNGYMYCGVRYFKMTTGQLENYGAISVTYLVEDEQSNFRQNTVTLEAWRDGTLVGSDSTYLDNVVGEPSRHKFGASRLEVSGVEFDMLRIVSAGPENDGIMVGSFDNVLITPEPGAAALLAFGAFAMLRRGRTR